MKTYRCKKCNHIFSLEEDKYCTACGCEDLEVIKQEVVENGD